VVGGSGVNERAVNFESADKSRGDETDKESDYVIRGQILEVSSAACTGRRGYLGGKRVFKKCGKKWHSEGGRMNFFRGRRGMG